MAAESPTDLEIIETSPSESAAWHAYVHSAAEKTFFHSRQWIDLIASSFGHHAKRLFCLRRGQPLAAMVFFEKHRLFWKIVTPVPLFPFTAPLFNPPADQKKQKMIADQLDICASVASYMNGVYDYWILDAPPTQQDMRGYLWHNARVQPHYTYLVELAGEQKLLSGCSQSTRKKIKQAESADYVIRESKEAGPLTELISHSYKRHGISPLIEETNLKLFISLALELANVRLFYLTSAGKIISARLVLYDRETIYDLLAGSDDPQGSASTYLVYYIMRNAMSDYRYFDFMGADHPAIEQFKRGFGGRLSQSFRIYAKPGFIFSFLIKANDYRLIRKRRL
jgi:CelD/BcsL family acetyltransferase involved in cellulose biosynthesis